MSPKRIIQDCQRLNWLILSTIVLTKSSTADLATSRECADNIPLMHPYARPRKRRIRGFEARLGIRDRDPATAMIVITNNACIAIQITKVLLPISSSNWFRVCAGSGIAPKIAISTAPADTNRVPPKDQRVKGSPRIRVAHIELKTSPDACNVDNTGSGRVVIWIVLPTKFDIINIPIPSCHLLRLWGGRRTSWGPFSSSRIWDFR